MRRQLCEFARYLDSLLPEPGRVDALLERTLHASAEAALGDALRSRSGGPAGDMAQCLGGSAPHWYAQSGIGGTFMPISYGGSVVFSMQPLCGTAALSWDGPAFTGPTTHLGHRCAESRAAGMYAPPEATFCPFCGVRLL